MIRHNEDGTVSVFLMCEECGQAFGVHVDGEEWENFRGGEVAAKAFPLNSRHDQLLVSTGSCEQCFNEVVNDYEYDHNFLG